MDERHFLTKQLTARGPSIASPKSGGDSMESLVAIMEALGRNLDQLHEMFEACQPELDHVRRAQELTIKAIVLAQQLESANIRRGQALALLSCQQGVESRVTPLV